MYLSRLTLAADAAHRPAFWQRLGDAYTLHQEVWRLHADDPDKDRDFLYRLDLHRGRPRLFTLSQEPPTAPDGLWDIESKPFSPQLQAGDRLAFQLRANPTIKRAGKRHDVVMDAKHRLREEGVPPMERPSQAELVGEHAPVWLRRKAEQLGADFDAVQADGYQVQKFSKPRKDAGGPARTVTVATCDFQGILTVIRPEVFVRAVEKGIGPAKGFGCGLMLLRRAG